MSYRCSYPATDGRSVARLARRQDHNKEKPIRYRQFEPIECTISCILKYETDYQIGDERLVIESRHLVPVSAPVESFPSPAKSLLLVSLHKRSRGQSIGNDLQFLFFSPADEREKWSEREREKDGAFAWKRMVCPAAINIM